MTLLPVWLHHFLLHGYIKLNTANMKRGTANAASIVTLALTPGADALSLVGLVFFTCLFDIAAFPF